MYPRQDLEKAIGIELEASQSETATHHATGPDFKQPLSFAPTGVLR